VGPIQVGTVAAGLVGACSIATLFGLVNMSLGRVLILVSANVMYMMIGGTAMWLVLRAPKIGPGICATAGAAAGLTAAVALVVVIEVFRRGEGSSVAGLVMIFVAAFGLVFGLLLGVALTRFAQAIARAAASSALDRADRALSTSAWWLLASGGACALVQARRADPSTLVGLLALVLAGVACAIVAAREQQRRRLIEEAEAHGQAAGGAAPSLAILPAADVCTGDDPHGGAPFLCSGDPGDSLLVESLVASGPIFRTPSTTPRILARVTPRAAVRLAKRRAAFANAGTVLALALALATALAILNASHYR